MIKFIKYLIFYHRVRQQFYTHTSNFLIAVSQKNLRKEYRKHFASFESNELYKE